VVPGCSNRPHWAGTASDGASKRHAIFSPQAGPSGDALEIAVPAALTRLFRHPTLDWGLMSAGQKALNDSRQVGRCQGLGLPLEVEQWPRSGTHPSSTLCEKGAH
jgi:hypothetical protein